MPCLQVLTVYHSISCARNPALTAGSGSFFVSFYKTIIMSKDKTTTKDQAGGITHKKDLNAGSAAFNEGTAQDPDYDAGTEVSDEEKKTGHTPSPGKAGEKGRNIEDRKNKALGE